MQNYTTQQTVVAQGNTDVKIEEEKAAVVLA